MIEVKEGNTFSGKMKGGSVMERRSQFSQKQKLDILKSTKDVGIKESADVVGVHYPGWPPKIPHSWPLQNPPP
ncbi:MAG: hypothetical protein H8E00_00815, partial [Deltaproteobacteria bacterium]|nr:hypothetical protein [Deltaproteobacteria bacterium]